MKKSFTMVELLVTLAVIALITAFTLPQLAKVKVRTNLKNTALEIQSAVLQTKNYALSPRKSGTGIISYKIVFNKAEGSYEIFENYQDNSISLLIPGTERKLPKDVSFKDFNWGQPTDTNKAEIEFSVKKQAEIVNEFTSSPAEIIIEKTGYKIWKIKVIKATGAVSVCEGKGC